MNQGLTKKLFTNIIRGLTSILISSLIRMLTRILIRSAIRRLKRKLLGRLMGSLLRNLIRIWKRSLIRRLIRRSIRIRIWPLDRFEGSVYSNVRCRCFRCCLQGFCVPEYKNSLSSVFLIRVLCSRTRPQDFVVSVAIYQGFVFQNIRCCCFRVFLLQGLL